MDLDNAICVLRNSCKTKVSMPEILFEDDTVDFKKLGKHNKRLLIPPPTELQWGRTNAKTHNA